MYFLRSRDADAYAASAASAASAIAAAATGATPAALESDSDVAWRAKMLNWRSNRGDYPQMT